MDSDTFVSYHIEPEYCRPLLPKLPERILMREDGYLGAYRFHGEPIKDYWYVPEHLVEKEKEKNKRLSEIAQIFANCLQEAGFNGVVGNYNLDEMRQELEDILGE